VVNARLGSLLSGVVLAAWACSARGSPPMALHADMSYPRPTNEVCSGGTAPGSLRVEVTDELRTALPQVPVYLLPMGFARVAAGAPPSPTAISTDSAGVATFNGPGGEYTVVVAMAGFVPQMRAIEIGPGCSGTLKVVLRVALRERLEALNAGRPAE
jgi:hypothetical protein